LAAEKRLKLEQQGVPYALSESYRHMCRWTEHLKCHLITTLTHSILCRFQSGYFFRHPLLDEYEYYWRLEPYVDYYCKIDYDVFKYMKDNKKKYGNINKTNIYKCTCWFDGVHVRVQHCIHRAHGIGAKLMGHSACVSKRSS
jgi:hypothetical protein